MKKLFKILLAFAFVSVAFFTTGCDNSDDYNKWKRMVETDSLLLKVGLPALSGEMSSGRTVIIGGTVFSFTESRGGLDYFTQYLPKTVVNNSVTALKFQINNTVFYVDSNFFKNALNNASKGSQPTALLTFDQIFNILSAENNGTSVEKPSVWQDSPEPGPQPQPTVEANVTVSLSGDTATSVVPVELGNVTSVYSWEIVFTPLGSSNSHILYNGQHSEMYNITNNGNSFSFTITEAGKAKLQQNTTYIVYLKSAVVYTDKYGDKPVHLVSTNNIYYSK